MTAKILVVLAVIGFLLGMVVHSRIHTGDMNFLAMYVEVGLPILLLALGLVLMRLDRIEKLLEKK